MAVLAVARALEDQIFASLDLLRSKNCEPILLGNSEVSIKLFIQHICTLLMLYEGLRAEVS